MSFGTVHEVASLLEVQSRGADARWNGVSTDTRTLKEGELFFALNGPNFRGRDFVKDAANSGAAGAVVEGFVDVDIAQVEVYDARHALGVVAVDWRSRFELALVGVTGSNGKTTVKQMISACLGSNSLATRGNLNNDIGVPLMLLELDESHESAVIEMGANHAGEIAYLASLARPNVAVVTNAGPSHLEGFGSIDGVAHAKGELFYSLNSDAVAIINRDDKYFDLWCSLAEPASILTFGRAAPADCFATDVQLAADHSSFALNILGDTFAIRLPLPGEHNVLNACAAALASVAAGIPAALVAERLPEVSGAAGRLQVTKTAAGGALIDDTYNANPASMRAAATFAVGLERDVLMVIGDMGELGKNSDALHTELGRDLANLGVRKLYAVGENVKHCIAGFGEGATHFADHEAVISKLLNEDLGEFTVLVKGSRSARMETVVAALRAAGGEA